MTSITITQAIEQYLDSVYMSRSENTARTYGNALRAFAALFPRDMPIDQLTEQHVVTFVASLGGFAVSTEKLYLTAVHGFYEFLIAERLVEINLARLNLLIRKRSRRPGGRLPDFPFEAIESVLEYAKGLHLHRLVTVGEYLVNLRDRAFLLTLADTGLRVHEICALSSDDLDWQTGKALVIGKGNNQAVIRFSNTALGALRDYLEARERLDPRKCSGAFPLFVSHDKRNAKQLVKITTATGRNIVRRRAFEALGDAENTITPHSFRHYFITKVLKQSGNLKVAQEFARHKNIAVTQRYVHLNNKELDNTYAQIFNLQDEELKR